MKERDLVEKGAFAASKGCKGLAHAIIPVMYWFWLVSTER